MSACSIKYKGDEIGLIGETVEIPLPLYSSDQWFSARLQYLQCISNGDTAVVH